MNTPARGESFSVGVASRRYPAPTNRGATALAMLKTRDAAPRRKTRGQSDRCHDMLQFQSISGPLIAECRLGAR